MNPTVGNSRVSISVTMIVIIVMGLLAVSCTTGSPAETLAPSPVVIEREVVRTVVVEVEKPVVQEVTKLVEVVERDPDVMLVVRHGSPSEAREENFSGLFSNPAWAGLTAAQSGRTHELSEWLYLRYPGPRVVWAMEELRPLLYPETQAGSGG